MKINVNENYSEMTYNTSRINTAKEIKAKRKANERKLIEQKLFGVAFIFISVALPIIEEGDITASILFFPLGLYLLITREIIID